MNSAPSRLTMTIPLTRSNFASAEEVSQSQSDPSLKRQIYLHTLAIQVVDCYCRCLGVNTESEKSERWDAIHANFYGALDLRLATGERLECCPILPGQEACQVPPEVRSIAAGYLLVEIDEAAKIGTILGFTRQLENHRLDRSTIESLEDFIDFSQKYSLSPKEYLEQLFSQEWQAPMEILVPSYRRNTIRQTDEPNKVRKAQKIVLGDRPLVIILHLTWQTPDDIDIYARIHPLDAIKSLPEGLYLALLDKDGKVLTEKVAAPGDNCLQIRERLPRGHQCLWQITSDRQTTIKKLGFPE
jgi:Protein of unknown function (DUF1822)